MIRLYLMLEAEFSEFQNFNINLFPSFIGAAGANKEYSFGIGCTYVADEIPGTYSI